MKKIITLTALSLLIAASAGAQTMYDAANIASKDLNGTARFVGMGGAMGALGGDISTIGTNPAGIGIYRSNDIMTSFGFSGYGTESKFGGDQFNSNMTRGSFDNIGVVFSSKIGNQTPLRYVNFGFNYKKAKSFNRNMEMGGNIGQNSQTFQMANQANGITGWGDNPYTDSDIGWLSILGFDSGLINDIMSQPDLDQALEGNPGLKYKKYLDKNDNQLKDIEGNLLYITPGSYRGMYDNANTKFRSQERGGIDQYDFNLSFNLNDRIYLGATIGAYSVNYSKYSFYDEDYQNGEGYNIQSWNKIKGSGFDLKFGMILRPFEYSPLRIGLALHTPTFYSLELATSARIESDVFNIETGEVDHRNIDSYGELKDKDMVREFNLRTPWVYNLSLGYTVGKSLALGAEYEYQDYASMRFNYPEGGEMTYETSTVKKMLKGVHTLRLGAEYKVIPQFALRAGYNFSSTAFENDAYKALDYNSINT
ncbi:MAG: TonB-dependent receptor, partial [Bacteroides sp.]